MYCKKGVVWKGDDEKGNEDLPGWNFWRGAEGGRTRRKLNRKR